MKYLLLALPATLLATSAFGQTIEYSGRATAGFSEFRGDNATTTTAIVSTNDGSSESSRAINPYGKRLGTGFGASVRAQRVGKIGLLTAFAGAGWRLGGEKLKLDALVGPELAYVLNATEKGSGTSSVNGGWSSDLSRSPANRLDFRLRGDVTVWRDRVGLTASYSYGFANYQPGTTTVPSPDASVRLARVGLAYRFR
ncbi:MAG: hypothetical protein EOO59_13275 [Hymenobacter sp.]|nr:MAG: hypothetical protein EOO59_13275 [Hymenobacter sp.]